MKQFIMPLVLVLLAALSFLGYYIDKTINYELVHESKVEKQINKTITEKVLEKCLK
jgi:hypothetical protein